MIKVSALKKYGIELVEGDKTNYGPSLTPVGVKQVIDGDYEYDFCITEFAWREPTKKQPVNGEVFVSISLNSPNGSSFICAANDFSWPSFSIYKKWKPDIQWLMAQEDKNKQEDEMIELKEISNLDQDIASIKERELHKSPIIPFEPLTKTLTKKDYLISKAADSLTHTQYMQFMSIVDVLIEKEIIK